MAVHTRQDKGARHRPPAAGAGSILVCNAGSSSLKMSLFTRDLVPGPAVAISEIGGRATLDSGAGPQPVSAPDHGTALDAGLGALGDAGVSIESLRAVGHRVVHGGPRLSQSVRLDGALHDEIAACADLAPLHNPPALRVIGALARRYPGLAQTASFDTAFHVTNSEVATRYALPDIPATQGLRRYGFHGLSYAALTRTLPKFSGAPLPGRLLAFHLGNGASACAIRDGQSVATTMGYSPLDGLTMGTRPGSLDPEVVLTLAERLGVSRARELLNREAGLKGLAGHSDMRALLASDEPAARFAVAHFCHWAVRHGGTLVAAMGGCDAIAFTGGIGERAAPVRAAIATGFSWLGLRLNKRANDAGRAKLHKAKSGLAAWIAPAREEEEIARDALRLTDNDGQG